MYVFTLLLYAVHGKNVERISSSRTWMKLWKKVKNVEKTQYFAEFSVYTDPHACIAYILFSANTVISSVQNFFYLFLFVVVEFLG
jgi:hypothetical protein